MAAATLDVWRRFLGDKHRQWVLFRNGTCVVLDEKNTDARSRAITLLKNEGKVAAGSTRGDFSVISLQGLPGWMVLFYRHDIVTHIDPSEVPINASDAQIGLVGRAKRHRDSETLDIVHIEM